MTRKFFVTATDTGAGKTVVTAALVAACNRAGIRSAAIKPIASGSILHEGIHENEDVIRLREVNHCQLPPKVMNRYHFHPPVAPLFAAACGEKITIDTDQIRKDIQYASQLVDVLFVEGVGGWLTPLSKKSPQTIAELAVALELPVIVVAGIRLGVINHSLLTLHAIQSSNINVTGWIANIIPSDTILIDENIRYLQQKLSIPYLLTVPVCKQVIDCVSSALVIQSLKLHG